MRQQDYSTLIEPDSDFKMIDEKQTYEKFAYYSTDLAPRSSKKIIAICNDCGKIRELEKSQYKDVCHKCSFKYRKYNRTPEGQKRMLEGYRKFLQNNPNFYQGENHPFYGRKHSEETKKIFRLKCPRKKGFKCPEEVKRKISIIKKEWCKNRPEFNVGSSNSAWKGGITAFNKSIRDCAKYYEWRIDILKRDNFTCQECGKNCTKIFRVHHIKSFEIIMIEQNIKDFDTAMNCVELWDISNGITLCPFCHSGFHRQCLAA